MDNTGAQEPEIPLEEDLMRLARYGEIGLIQKLFKSGKADASSKDETGVTPLHWAAIKGHFALCHFLIQSGADVNAKGGDLEATPALWAARSCNYYIVHLLLQHGADPLKTDNQGFNLLQNAAQDGNAYQLLLILNQDVAVDVPDNTGHTSLMWAAYKGNAPCVEVLLRWGANVNVADDNGFTALHWSIVRGNAKCIQRLIEYGADRSAVTKDGKNMDLVSREMNNVKNWQKALAACGLNPNGTMKTSPLSSFTSDTRLLISRTSFVWPFVMIGMICFATSSTPIYYGLPVGVIIYGLMYYAMTRILKWAPPSMQSIPHTPFLAGIFSGTLFWVGLLYIARILPVTFWVKPLENLIFAALYGLCSYFYFSAMFENPGYISKSTSRDEQRVTVQELVNERRFEERHFCLQCMIRKPLRSKHCWNCGRCVAKYDHHCPWINNCVGNDNHRHFFYYLLAMEVGVSLLVWITMKYIEALAPVSSPTCTILRRDLCASFSKDPFTVIVIIWTAFQLSWVTMILSVQFLNVTRGLTTSESMKHIDYLSDTEAKVTSALVAGTTSLDDAGLTIRDPGAGAPSNGHEKRKGCWEQWQKLLGLDTFMATAMYGSRAAEVQARQRRNPFSNGCYQNSQDFFCDPAPLFGQRQLGEARLAGRKVDYTSMYQPPSRDGMQATRRGGDGGDYETVAGEEEEV